MAGKRSRWLGPKTRKEVYGDENLGVPRPSRGPQPEPSKFWRGAKVR